MGVVGKWARRAKIDLMSAETWGGEKEALEEPGHDLRREVEALRSEVASLRERVEAVEVRRVWAVGMTVTMWTVWMNATTRYSVSCWHRAASSPS